LQKIKKIKIHGGEYNRESKCSKNVRGGRKKLKNIGKGANYWIMSVDIVDD